MGTIIRNLSQATPAQRIDLMIAILSALTLLAATWLRKRTAAAKPQLAQQRAAS
jgi:hypothetical protein